MLKKITSLLLSLLLCLSLLPGQARAADEPDPPQPLVIEAPVMLMSEEMPQKEDTHL